jgi:hypothetical protein
MSGMRTIRTIADARPNMLIAKRQDPTIRLDSRGQCGRREDRTAGPPTSVKRRALADPLIEYRTGVANSAPSHWIPGPVREVCGCRIAGR